MKTVIPLPSQERLRELLSYDPESGIFTWKVNRPGTAQAGAVAGWLHKRGYIELCIDGKFYKAHRIAWMMYYGQDPGELVIDHKYGDKSDNRISELRLATNSQNSINRKSTKGCSWNKEMKKWRARIMHHGKAIHLGYFINYEDARQAYECARKELFGEFAPQT